MISGHITFMISVDNLQANAGGQRCGGSVRTRVHLLLRPTNLAPQALCLARI
jgi:hypothetical protein